LNTGYFHMASPFTLRPVVFAHRRRLLDLLFPSGRKPCTPLPPTPGRSAIGFTLVLHTDPRTPFHPQLHAIVTAAASASTPAMGRSPDRGASFPVAALRVFRGKFPDSSSWKAIRLI
jgi:hypothetical protein